MIQIQCCKLWALGGCSSYVSLVAHRTLEPTKATGTKAIIQQNERFSEVFFLFL